LAGAETDPEDLKLAYDAGKGRDAIYSGNYDLVVLDEINYTISTNADPEESGGVAEEQARECACHLHWPQRASEDHRVGGLVTEMREVKHPYTKGILAQRGIDY